MPEASEDLDTIMNVYGLSPTDPLDTFTEMWYQVFLWALFSSLFVHFLAGSIAVCMLRQHKTGRFVPVGIFVMGVVSPLTGGVVTSAVIAGVYRASSFEMAPFYALVYGIGQTAMAVIMSFTRMLATL